MKPVNNNLTADELRSLLTYNPETGEFRWRHRDGEDAFNAKYAGKIAGCKRARGYVTVKINQGHFSAHRLAWLYMTGEWPAVEIDHKDKDPANNRFENLRPANRGENGANRGVQCNNSARVKGVYFSPSKGKWVAQAGGKDRRIVRYAKSKDEAQELCLQAARQLFGEFARA